jgi:hypothetical protein
MDTALQAPIAERINFRLIAFLLILALPIGFVGYYFVGTLLTGGVWERQDEQGAYKEVDLRAMSTFEMPPLGATDAMIPPKWRALDGQRVLLKGEMVPGGLSIGGDSDFDLCYSIAKCCFSGAPKIQHFVKSRMPPGRQIRRMDGIVEVKGILRVGIERNGPDILSVYRMDVESIRQR